MKTKRFLFTLLIVTSALPAIYAQNEKLDSLVNLLSQHPTEDTVRVNLLNKIAWSLISNDSEKMWSYAEQASVLAEKLNFIKGIAIAYDYMGHVRMRQGDYPKALEYYQKSLKERKEIGNKSGIAASLSHIGSIFRRQSNYSKALEYYQKSLKIDKEIGDKKGISSTSNNIGIVYYRLGNYPMALEHYQKSLKLNEETGNVLGTAISNNNIGDIYLNQRKYNLALEYYQKSLKSKEEIGDKMGVANSLNNIGLVFINHDNYPKALEYHQRSLKIKKEIGDKDGICESYKNMGALFIKLRDYTKALEYTLKSLEVAEELETLDKIKELRKQLADIYEATQNFKLAYKSHVLYKQLNDSIFNEESIKKITGLEYQYEFDKEKQAMQLAQEKKDALMEAEIKRERLIQYSALGGLVLVLLLAINLYRLYRIKIRANQQLFDKNKIIEEGNEKLRNTLLELKTTQSSLVQSAKMASLGVLSAGVAHEINNPLNFIKGGALGLAKSLKNLNLKNEDRINKFINAINEGVDRVTSFVTSLSRFSQNDNNMEEECDFHDILENCLVLLQSNLKEKIIVKKNFTKDQVIRNGNSGQLHQALFNILTNAAQAIPETGEIEISTNLDANSDSISITIADTGEGIDSTILDKIMDPLFTTRNPGEGMGLGLSIAFKNIEDHGGDIKVRSEVGEGTKFTITLVA